MPSVAVPVASRLVVAHVLPVLDGIVHGGMLLRHGRVLVVGHVPAAVRSLPHHDTVVQVNGDTSVLHRLTSHGFGQDEMIQSR